MEYLRDRRPRPKEQRQVRQSSLSEPRENVLMEKRKRKRNKERESEREKESDITFTHEKSLDIFTRERPAAVSYREFRRVAWAF